jgi:hypothetical protein
VRIDTRRLNMPKDKFSTWESAIFDGFCDLFSYAVSDDKLVQGFASLDLRPITVSAHPLDTYYLPVECTAKIGSNPSTWLQWGSLATRLLLGEDEGSATHERNLPMVTLSESVLGELSLRGIKTRPKVRVVSAPLVAFFIAAQYEAWATKEEVEKVRPFKNLLVSLGYSVRECEVRKTDDGVKMSRAEVQVANSTSTPISAPESVTTTVVVPVAAPEPVTTTVEEPTSAPEPVTTIVAESQASTVDIEAFTERMAGFTEKLTREAKTRTPPNMTRITPERPVVEAAPVVEADTSPVVEADPTPVAEAAPVVEADLTVEVTPVPTPIEVDVDSPVYFDESTSSTGGLLEGLFINDPIEAADFFVEFISSSKGADFGTQVIEQLIASLNAQLFARKNAEFLTGSTIDSVSVVGSEVQVKVRKDSHLRTFKIVDLKPTSGT